MMPDPSQTSRPRGDTPGYFASKEQIQKRLARIEGQVRGISRMVGDDRYCIDILTQISAIQAALDRVALGLLDDHARHCMTGPGSTDRDDRVQEMMGAVGRLLRS
jgi:DNA-binding FrmR family transcriptional regulator